MSSNKSRILKNIISSILIVLIFFCSFIALINITFNFLYIQTPVKGFSMQPTINKNVTDAEADGDTIYINKYANINSNDIVVADVDWYEHYIIKRVVGKPGDKIEIKNEENHFAVYVNNELFYTKEKYGENSTFNKTGSYAYYAHYLAFLNNPEFQQYVKTENGSPYIQLGENDFFLMGDNWGHTTDSIEKGPIKTNEIVGKVELIVDTTNTNPFVATWHFLKKIFS